MTQRKRRAGGRSVKAAHPLLGTAMAIGGAGMIFAAPGVALLVTPGHCTTGTGGNGGPGGTRGVSGSSKPGSAGGAGSTGVGGAAGGTGGAGGPGGHGGAS